MLGRTVVLAALLAAPACTRSLSVTVELAVPEAPGPFEGVSVVRLRALASGRIEVAGQDRWDQGPIDLPVAIAPEVERIVVEGLDGDGNVVSFGSSSPLDLLRAPPDGPIRIMFSRLGEVSLLSARLGERRGGRAVSLEGGRVLFAGGADAAGCAIEETELATTSLELPRRGPQLIGGRLGRASLLSLGGGRALMLGGDDTGACGAPSFARRPAILDADANTSIAGDTDLEAVRPGASIVAVSPTLVLMAGGDLPGGVSDEAFRFNPQTMEVQAAGKLETPRSESAAVAISGDRVLFLGGRSRLDDASALSAASVFDPVRGAASPSRFTLGAPLIGGAAVVTGAGSAIVAGGRRANGEPETRVRAVVAQPAGVQAFGDTSTVTALSAASARGDLIDLDDGTALYLPDDPAAALERLSLLSGASQAIPLPSGVAGPLTGGRTADGVVLLRSGAGELLIYNPGPASVFGAVAAAEALAGRSGPFGQGIVPLRPKSWTLEGGRLTGRLAPELPSGLQIPWELAVLGSSTFADFDVAFTLELGPLSQAALVFAMDEGELDELVFLGGLTLVSRLRATPSPLSCNSSQTPQLGEPGPHPVRVRRRGAEVRADLDADGTDDLICTTPRPVAGRIAFGVIAGEATFSGLELSN